MYKLTYKIDGISATVCRSDPKDLRVLIAELEKSRKTIEWWFYNCGGICLDSSKEHEEEKKKKK